MNDAAKKTPGCQDVNVVNVRHKLDVIILDKVYFSI